MIDITNQQEQWIGVWERQAGQTGPAAYGVEGLLRNNTKLYRAWASVMLNDEEKRVVSPEYEACDAADVDESRLAPHGIIVPEVLQREDLARAEAAVARRLMTDKQRSPKDMQALALELARQLNAEARAYDEAMLAAQRQRAYDEQCLEVARPWLRGIQLLMEQGTASEKATLRALFGRKEGKS